MTKKSTPNGKGKFSPEIISRFKKERFIRSMSEDEFRDKVVRPLFLRKQFKDGRDLCGPQEEGKDTIFVEMNRLGFPVLYAVQTKKGNLNLSKKASNSVIEAKTQLKTALDTKIYFTLTQEKLSPTYAILCASGKINESARKYIVDEINSTRIRFIDLDDLIPEIDKVFPELWLGIDSDKFPYLRRLKENLTASVEDFAVSDVLPTGPVASSVSDGMFVELHLARRTFKMKLYRGQAVKEPKLEQIPASALLRRKERHFLVTGEAGSGKSTLLRRLAFQMAERGLSDQLDIEIPVLLRAVDIFRSNQGIIEFCNETTSELSLSGKPAFTIDDLNIGRVTVFVDALDELSSNEERQEVLSKIAKFISSYPKCRVILTSRDYSFVTEFDELRQYVRFSLTPIDWKEAELIIKRLHKAKPIKEETAQELLRRLQDVHGIQLNPLLVTVFVATSDYSRRDIPANITELFKKFTEMMLGRWDAAKGLSQQYHAPLKDFLLTQLGFEMHRRRITSITLEECKRMLTNDLISRGRTADTDQLLKEIIDRSGMFRFIGDSVEFRHFLLQEFFAGRGAPSAEFLQSVISDEWWQRPMVFYFGENPSDHVSLESILENIDMRTEGEIFKAAIAVGLALQACYLIRTENRINIFEWVVRSLCAARNLILEETGTVRTRFPLTRFLGYYLFGRDAVACDVLRENTDRILAELQAGDIPSDENDLLVFWTIVGLIEGGHLEKAEELVKNFHPKDLRLSLAIHLGCFLIEKLRASTPLEKRLAKRICSYLDPTISHLRTQVLDEMKSQLLEVQKGQIQSIEFTNEKKRKKGETH